MFFAFEKGMLTFYCSRHRRYMRLPFNKSNGISVEEYFEHPFDGWYLVNNSTRCQSFVEITPFSFPLAFLKKDDKVVWLILKLICMYIVGIGFLDIFTQL